MNNRFLGELIEFEKEHRDHESFSGPSSTGGLTTKNPKGYGKLEEY